MAKSTGKKRAVTPIQVLRAKLTAKFKQQLKEKLAARDAVWRLRLQTAKLSAAGKRDAAADRRRATKERKSERFWARKAANGCAGVSHGKHFWR